MSDELEKHTLKIIKQKIAVAKKNLNDLDAQYGRLLKKKKKLEYQLVEKKKAETLLSYITKEILTIKLRYKELGIESTLNLNQSYNEKIKTKVGIQEKIVLLPKNLLNELLRNKSNIENNRKSNDIELQNMVNLKEQLLKINNSKRIIIEKTPVYHSNIIEPSKIVEVEIQRITYKDGYILILVNAQTLLRYELKESRKYLNNIKSIYKFRNAPKILVEISAGVIKGIRNVEVLFYYITVLRFCNSFQLNIEPYRQKNISFVKSFSKSFYLKNLPELFTPKCFETLCKYSSDCLPIIPLPEMVLNSKGNYHIHDSFIFPIIFKNQIYWIWESIEETKATYVFQTSLEYENIVQKIFDYLTGNTSNKRLTMINSSEIKSDLNFIERFYHTDFNEWNKHLKIIIF